MCWKQEWAHAINNLQHAIKHVERAKGKLIKRKERNEAALKKKRADRYETKKILARITTNNQGIAQCEHVIHDLKEWQDVLFKMVHEYGISHSDNPKRVYKLMGKYPYAEKLKEFGYEVQNR